MTPISSVPRMSRRTVLRGVLGGASVGIGLPLFEAMIGRRAGADENYPRRFLLFFWGNGNLPERWVPAEVGTEWVPTDQLEPVAALRDKLCIVSGLSVKTGNTIPHFSGAAGMLSGAPLNVRSRDDSTFRLPSIDQVIAREIGASTRFRSLELGVAPRLGLSFNGPDSRNPPEAAPSQAFVRLFGGGFRAPGDMTEPDPRLRLRRSVLDAVRAEAAQLHGQLGQSDKLRLDQHLTGIRELELRLERLETSTATLSGCQKPPPPTVDENTEGRRPLAELSAAMTEILALALACDQTRVASLWFSYPVQNLLYPEATSGHHQLTHDEPGDQPEVNRIVRFIMTRLSELLTRMDAVQEGSGTLLDHTLVMATSDVSLGRNHSISDMPVILAGGFGRIRRGLHYRSGTSESTSRLLLTATRVMGLRLDSIGEGAGLSTESLGDIET